MKIELKKIRYYESMSEETCCFQGEIYCDGVNIGYCRNDGRGGDTLVRPHVNHRQKFEEVENYCLGLPDISITPTSKIDSNLENFVDELFFQWLEKKSQK